MTDLADIPKLRRPTLDKPGKRKPLTREQVIILCLRQVGLISSGWVYYYSVLCGCGCGAPLKPKCIDEHLDARDSQPADKADLLSNRALYNPECAKKKTVADSAIVAKGRRVRGERGSQQARRAKSPSLKTSRRIEGRGKLQGAKFKKHPHLKRSVSGEVVPR